MKDTSATRAQTQALRDGCRRLRLQSSDRQRESAELRNACQEVGQACRVSIERSMARRQPGLSRENGHSDLANTICYALAGVGIKTFILESLQDSALIA
jgi:hypothetical protein